MRAMPNTHSRGDSDVDGTLVTDDKTLSDGRGPPSPNACPRHRLYHHEQSAAARARYAARAVTTTTPFAACNGGIIAAPI